jgi:CheY-like chemotaxis protein
MGTIDRFICIDDDSINNLICRLSIKRAFKEAEIQTFEAPKKGLEFIQNEYSKTESETTTVLLLDVNMPGWSGWDFLDNFEKLENVIKKQFRIYMLSSSVDPKDKARARLNKFVVDCIEKPLSDASLQSMKYQLPNYNDKFITAALPTVLY